MSTEKQLPEGYVSWLDYAADTFDAKGASEMLYLEGWPISHLQTAQEIRQAALDELHALRSAAASASLDKAK